MIEAALLNVNIELDSWPATDRLRSFQVIIVRMSTTLLRRKIWMTKQRAHGYYITRIN